MTTLAERAEQARDRSELLYEARNADATGELPFSGANKLDSNTMGIVEAISDLEATVAEAAIEICRWLGMPR